MNILILGNGFDLAHGLLTRYSDFLDFIKIIKEIGKQTSDKEKGNIIIQYQEKTYQFLEINMKNVTDKYRRKFIRDLQKLLVNDFCNSKNNPEIQKNNQYLLDCASNNIWLKYFIENEQYIKENWIDFESEISKVIKALDNARKRIPLGTVLEVNEEAFFLNCIRKASKFELNEIFSSIEKLDKFTENLEKDLNDMIECLEIYITEYVDKLEINNVSPDVTNYKPDKILSFNYTNTYEKKYDEENKKCDYDYIHGKAKKSHEIEENNMVLGIDEYLKGNRITNEIEFISFKKYFQRIHKQTGCKYKDWIGEIKDDWENARGDSKKEIMRRISQNNFEHTSEKLHRLHIYGHSLDVTDKDILKDLILNDNVQTTIFYCNKKVFGQQIANLVKVIGQDELIKRTGGPNKTIIFEQQLDMEEM